MGEGRARRADALEGRRGGGARNKSLPAGFESPLAHHTQDLSSDSGLLAVARVPQSVVVRGV